VSEPAVPTTTAISTELPFGATLQDGRYEIHRKLGRGGFGITYAATDRRLHRDVAIKELCFGAATRVGGRLAPPPHEAEAFAAAKDRFLREAAVLARFSHPSVVRIYEVFEEAGTAYLVMELLDGRTLHQLVTQHGVLAEEKVLDIAARCGEALSVLHSAGVLHRDINPSNVVLTPEGRVVLIDFGLAREFADDATTPMTRIVTPGYAAPEQYEHSGRLGPATDVFGLAATVYCALTGRAPVAREARGRGSAFVAPRVLTSTVSKFVSDAVLDGLGSTPVVYKHHAEDVTTVPDGFAVVARSQGCAVEAIAAPHHRWWGTQFHPECFSEEHPDGGRVLANFFALAGLGERCQVGRPEGAG